MFSLCCAFFFLPKLKTALLLSAETENDRIKYFIINLHERLLQDPAGMNQRPPDQQSDALPTEPPRPIKH